MPTALQSAIHQLAEKFSAGVLAAIRSASLEEIQGGAPPSRGPGRPRVSAPGATAPTARKGAGRPKRAKDSGADTLLDNLVDLLRKHPKGLRSEVLRAELGIEKVPFREIARVAEDANLIRRTGEKRATTFFAKPTK